LIRPSSRLASFIALAAFALPSIQAAAQQKVPPAPDASAATPSAPAPVATPTFPKPDPANFTASSPTKEAVNAFIQISWGYDDSRVWQVQAIRKTVVEGISQVIVLVGDKTGKQKTSVLQFYMLPDGKHIMAGDEIIPFGDHPYAENRALLQQRANGPYRGSASKDLELVEFADFQCPHCKDAQANMDKLAVDFPKARIVYQSFPLEKIHAEAKIAATYGVCVAKLGGSDAFFSFASAVFEGQDGLATPDGATLTLNSSVTKAGLDPKKVEDCAKTPEAGASVEDSVKLAQDLNIDQTPVLFINGRLIPVGGVPYETLKQLVQFQAKLDGVAVQ
jgi:protein-disulfide isomerase